MRDEIITKLNGGGREIALTADTLCKHTLFIGSTGSGKTTSLNVLLRGLIAFRADDKKRKIGLLLFDFKNDGTLYKIKKWALECGRMRDVVDFSGGGHYINPFAEINSPAKASEIVDFLMSAFGDNSGENAYWTMAFRKRLNTILNFCLFRHDSMDFDRFTDAFRDFLDSDKIDEWREFISSALPEICRCEVLDKSKRNAAWAQIKRIAKQLKSDLSEWQKLDLRTKSNETSTMTNTLALLENRTTRNFLSGKKLLDIGDIARLGKIVVLTFPATTNQFAAAIVAKLAKAQFYRSIQLRGDSPDNRLTGIVMDEFPLVATGGRDISSDAHNLQTMRSKGGFAVAATQGIVALDLAIGEMECAHLLANINNLFVFRTSEPEVVKLVEFAAYAPPSRSNIGFNADDTERREEFASPENLPQGYAFVKLANGFCTPCAVKLERLFVEAPRKRLHTALDVERECLSELRDALARAQHR